MAPACHLVPVLCAGTPAITVARRGRLTLPGRYTILAPPGERPMERYYIWTIGCQMNEADSGRVAAELDALGYAPTDSPKNADVIVLNTCVVRQSAEDKAYGRLGELAKLKAAHPEIVDVVVHPEPAG